MQPLELVITYDDEKPSSGSMLFTGETYTMGNALRQTILQNPKVNFCGYTVPHPAETKVALRVQADDDEKITDIVLSGISDFKQWCNNTETEFDNAWSAFQK
ncbi:RNA polymerase Rpb3/Rpb11 dimerization domain containing protein [Trichomonas vaginalis G3]|uniref:RNA polymerase Rpb3/Rpb11 dimerisation domain containing protein n=1 Tax=Trichomonas vaginalis (strain ATCC PRA-98 / G3) TaxID=412133 RepID=A2DKG2_TRIV3|nr:transcription by RNA polymerase I [Trichomonas vaginalis G3]EAY19139.1 RNA polymerase Rpb3/Rpb11 dimerization domain containing protein [Trichomonas vaginalis G3]KAI5490436.1 transcription by RNA polymerase I [Trichomonas vaginalis G3]|eukprot:XP_001580125.1 RNA polymerase Rpb3/Rpb11 dimerisation domain containing protein [Trichomonas vaginalis G3]